MNSTKEIHRVWTLGGFRIGNIRVLIEEEFPGFKVIAQDTNHEKKQFDFWIIDSKIENGKVIKIDEERCNAFMKKRIFVNFIYVPAKFSQK